MNVLRITLLHLAPRTGEFGHNRRLLKAAVDQAARLGTDWVVTPELCLSGYQFEPVLGTDWIEPQPDAWMKGFMAAVAELGVTLFLGHAERDSASGLLHNTVFVLREGELLGRQRKVAVVPVAETWATAGDTAIPMPVPPLRAGILICADAYGPRLAQHLRDQGADLLVSPAAWAPRPHGPEGAWEARSRETGLPLFVCNRAGQDRTLDFRKAESGVFLDGKVVFSHHSPDSTLIQLVWDLDARVLAARPMVLPVTPPVPSRQP